MRLARNWAAGKWKYVSIAYKDADGLNVSLDRQFAIDPQALMDGEIEAMQLAEENGYDSTQRSVHRTNMARLLWIFPVKKES